jgi:uncharacterized protein
MIRVVLPAHLRSLARVDGEVKLEIEGPVTTGAVLDALEARYPMLRGTVRDQVTLKRRPFVRFFACEQDLSHDSPDTPLPEPVINATEPFLIVGAVAGGSTHGKICYIEIPATDIARSAEFYNRVFGWKIRKRGDGATAFDDTTGQVSGAFVLGRPPAAQPGLVVYIMMDSVAAAVDAVRAAGGEIVQPIGVDAPEITARFRDPGGNIIALYQEPG